MYQTNTQKGLWHSMAKDNLNKTEKKEENYPSIKAYILGGLFSTKMYKIPLFEQNYQMRL